MTDTLNELIERCRAQGLRRTKALEQLLLTMLENPVPMNLTDLSNSVRMVNQCDKVTVYRLLQRLIENGIVRRLGLHERAAFFTLLLPDCHQDYLICTECGLIEAIDAPCPVHDLQNEIREKTGFHKLYHELEFFGVCPKCA